MMREAYCPCNSVYLCGSFRVIDYSISGVFSAVRKKTNLSQNTEQITKVRIKFVCAPCKFNLCNSRLQLNELITTRSVITFDQ